MQYIVDCFVVVWNCVGGGGPPNAAPEIDAANSVAAIALLLSIGAIVYRRRQQERQ